MKSAPKVLLLVHGASNAPGVGNVFLQDVVSCYPADKMVRYSLVADRAQEGRGLWCGHVPAFAYQTATSAYPVASSLYIEWFRKVSLQAHVERITDIIEEENIDLVWSVLNSPNVIHLTRGLMEQTDVPIVLTVWDPPELFAINSRIDRVTFGRLRKAYADILRHGKRVSVACKSMGTVFAQEYGIDGIPWIHGIQRDLWADQTIDPFDYSKGQIVIGFTGSLYAKSEWKALLRAIEAVDGYVARRQVKIKMLGSLPRRFTMKSRFVEYDGWHSLRDTLTMLSDVDVAYLPYWFNRKYSYVVRTSFPTKLSSYVAAGAPVLYHGPVESSPAEFLKSYPVGLACHSLEASDLLRALENLATSAEVRQRAFEARKLALRDVFDHEIMLSQFAKLLGIERSDLGQQHSSTR